MNYTNEAWEEEQMINLGCESVSDLIHKAKRLRHELTDAIDHMDWLDGLAEKAEAEVKRLRKGIQDALYLFQEAGNPKMSDKKRLDTICDALLEVIE